MKWEKLKEGDILPVKSWCENVEDRALLQASNLARHPALAHHVALMPDCHMGYGMPIGGVIAARDSVIPSAVGVDIGCGMRAVETRIPVERVASMEFRRAIQTRLKEFIPVGEGNHHKEHQVWDGFESYLDHNGQVADFASGLDRRNLGTLGGGNHFIEMQKSDEGFVCERWSKFKKWKTVETRDTLDLSEAPQAYKDIEDVIASETDLVTPLVRLTPLASLKG